MKLQEAMLTGFLTTQEKFDRLCDPLSQEERRIQPIQEASPPWWSVMHTGWFYARNILIPRGHEIPLDRTYDLLLNSYYHSLGPYLDQRVRGKLAEPSNAQAAEYRLSVRSRMERLLTELSEEESDDVGKILELALNHEEQHMELLMAEIKRIRGENPVIELRRPYTDYAPPVVSGIPETTFFIPFSAGLHRMGNVEGGWCWDNELSVHERYLPEFALLNRPVTNGEYIEFIEDGGYSDFRLWLSSAYDTFIKKESIRSPLYWQKIGNTWWYWTLSGMRPVEKTEPVCHVNFYEAHAFAKWKSGTGSFWRGVRLPTEFEWEHAARLWTPAINGNLLESGLYHPAAGAVSDTAPAQMIGDVWEWTTSHYEPYPGYRPLPWGLAEYNAKFMNNQRVLRGGSCATPGRHLRISYRNFWSPLTQFQFTGIRLAKDLF